MFTKIFPKGSAMNKKNLSINTQIDMLLSKNLKGDFYRNLKRRNKSIIKLYMKKFGIHLESGVKVTDMTTVYISRESHRLRLRGLLNGSNVTLYTLSSKYAEENHINMDSVQVELSQFLACIRQLVSCYELKRMESNIHM
jgi:hypothetical protein